MKYTIDRIEGKCAVCEDENGKMVNIPLSSLPASVKEGTKLQNLGSTYKVIKSSNEKQIKGLMNKLWK
jgi:hypothetical protein